MIQPVDSLNARHNGPGARPNLRIRNMRDETNAYYAEVVRKAAGVDEPVPYKLKLKVWHLAAMILAAVALCVGLWLS